MIHRVEVLRAILRCSRHRRSADRAALALRVDATEAELDQALATLSAEGLVVDDRLGSRLTLMGLAVAVASIPRPKPLLKLKARSAA
jgi:Mn-dependent DtxR family transcriptional regulator